MKRIWTNRIVLDDQVLGTQHTSVADALQEAMDIHEELTGIEPSGFWKDLLRDGVHNVLADEISDQILDLDTVAFCDIADPMDLYPKEEGFTIEELDALGEVTLTED